MEINLGFDVDEKTFLSLSIKQQNLLLYRTIRKNKGFHGAIKYIWLLGITTYLGILKFLGIQ